MVFTRLAVLLATSLADWTKCLLATGLPVLDEAMRQALHRAEVCLATIVAADRTYKAGTGLGAPHASVQRGSVQKECTRVRSPGFPQLTHLRAAITKTQVSTSATPRVSPRKGRVRVIKVERRNRKLTLLWWWEWAGLQLVLEERLSVCFATSSQEGYSPGPWPGLPNRNTVQSTCLILKFPVATLK